MYFMYDFVTAMILSSRSVGLNEMRNSLTQEVIELGLCSNIFYS